MNYPRIVYGVCAGQDDRCRDREVDNHPNLPSDPTKPDKQRFPGPGDRRGAAGSGSEGAARPHRPRRRAQRRRRQGQLGFSEEGRQVYHLAAS